MAWRVREHKHCKNWASFCLRFSLPPVFRWTRFCGHTKCLLFFFRCAHRKRNSRNLVCPQNRILWKAWGGRKTHAESRFLPCLRSRWRPVVVFLFSVCAILFSGYFLLNFFVLNSSWFFIECTFCIFSFRIKHKILTLKYKSAKRVFKNISGRVKHKKVQ